MPPAPLVQTACGVALLCEEPLPGLSASPAAGGEAAVRVRLRRMPAWLPAAAAAGAEWLPAERNRDPRRPELRVRLLEGGWFLLAYPDGTRFLLDRAGTEVWAEWTASSTLEDAATYLLGPVLGFLLRLRGTLALHASVVAVGGCAVALAGAAGAGKSTAAAAFARAGHAVLADDLAALDERGGGFLARPGFARVRLWDDSAAALFGSPEALPLLTPNWEKRYLDVSGAFPPAPLPLAAVYLLGARDETGPRVEAVAPAAGLVELVAHTSGGALLDAEMRRREFEALSRLVRAVPVRRLVPHTSPAKLPDLVRAVRDDLAALSRSAA